MSEVDEAIRQMLPQLLICLIKRAGGTLEILADEIDDTGQDLLLFDIDGQNFRFAVSQKS